MDKETILKMSREENEGQQDEWEQSVEEQADQIGKIVGLAICLLLVFLAEYVLHNRDVGRVAWIVFFAMTGSSDLYKYIKTKKFVEEVAKDKFGLLYPNEIMFKPE